MSSIRSCISAMIIAVCLLVGVTVTPVAAAPTNASTQTSSDICVKNMSKRVPVLLVHGWNSGPGTWGTDADVSSMVHAITKLSDVGVVSPFDYSAENQSWVDNSNIGPALAKRIACLAASSRAGGGPGKVVVVAHSMGGLATRYAANVKLNGISVSTNIGLVITISTPNNGSGWGKIAQDVVEPICSTVVSKISHIGDNNLCALTAMQGLATGSNRLNNLPWIPSNVPVLALGGDVAITTPIFDVTIKDTSSDLIVSDASAMDYNKETHFRAAPGSNIPACSLSLESLTALIGKALFNKLPNCWHSALVRNPQIEKRTTAAIAKYVSSLQPKAPANPFAAYVGEWQQHELDMKISKNGTGTVSYRNYGCPNRSNANGELIMCFVTTEFHLVQRGEKVVAVVDSSKAVTATNATDGQPDTRAEAQVAPGTAYPLTLSHGGNILAINFENAQYIGMDETCRAGSSLALSGYCG